MYPAGDPFEIVGLYDEPTEQISGTGLEIEILEGAPTLYVIYSEVAALAIGDKIEILEGPGVGFYVSLGTIREDDGAFARIALGDE